MESSVKYTKAVQDKIIKELEAMPSKHTDFTSFEDDVIRRFYPTLGGKAIASKLSRNSKQVSARAATLGIKFKVPDYALITCSANSTKKTPPHAT